MGYEGCELLAEESCRGGMNRFPSCPRALLSLTIGDPRVVTFTFPQELCSWTSSSRLKIQSEEEELLPGRASSGSQLEGPSGSKLTDSL